MSRGAIVVVGAGPTGVLLAAELARRGTEVRIIEKASESPNESRAGGVHSRTLELFQRLGIADELLGAGNPVGAFTAWSGGRRVLRVDFRRLDGPYPFMLHVPQYETQRVLDRYLEGLGVAIERGTELLHLGQEGDSVLVTTQAGGRTEAISAPYVVGCDGAHSTVRHEVGMPFEGQGYGQDWLGADVEVDWAYPENEAQIFASPSGVLACFPFGGGRWRVIAPQVADRPEEHARPGLDEVRALVDERGPGGMQIGNPTWVGAFRAARRSAPHYRQGRVLLAGDAVHIHSPAAGQGMNTGLGDAANLGWKLALVAGGRAPDGVLDTYEAERAPVARQVIMLTHLLVRVFGSDPSMSPMSRFTRNWLVPHLSAERHAQREIARRMSQQRISYQGSPLAVGGRGHGALRSGDRAPDVPRMLVQGRLTSAFELLAHPGHTVFVAGEAGRLADLDRELAERREQFRLVVVDPVQAFAQRYGLRDGWACVVRPDGYVGYLGPSTRTGDYLARCLLPSATGDQYRCA